jgi:P-type E1-E2 ATPase
MLAIRPFSNSHPPPLQIECDLTPLGFVVTENRLKSDSAPAIDTLRAAGIRAVIVTGDHPLTVR